MDDILGDYSKNSVGADNDSRLTNRTDFVMALEFTNKVGALAEEEAHHPDIHLSYGRVKIELWTHKIKGLTESDFILAAKIDRLRG